MKAFGSPPDFVQDGPFSRESLRGLEGVAVVVVIERLSLDIEQLWLTTAQVQTDVELRLRKAGIRVLREPERQVAPGRPYLYITLDIFQRSEDLSLYVYTLEVSLRQAILLERDVLRNTVTSFLPAATWSARFLGSVGRMNVRQLRDPIVDLVDGFINAYLSVNPAPTGGSSTSPPPAVKEKRR